MYEYVTEKKHDTSDQQEPEKPAEGFVFFGFGIHGDLKIIGEPSLWPASSR
jgi:nitrous oxide reductase